MAKVLLVDTNCSSQPIRRALEAQGHEVHVVGANPDDALARSNPLFIALDYSKPQLLLEAAKCIQAQAVIPGCNDVSYESCAWVAAQMGLPGLDHPDLNRTINHKLQFRQVGRDLGLSVPRLWEGGECPSQSVIVKPVDAFSGKGVTVLRQPTAEALRQATELARGVSRTGEYVIEDFVDGQLYSHSVFLRGGRIIQDVVVIEHGTANPFVVDTSRVVFDFPEALQNRMRRELEHLAQSLQLGDGLLHAQLIVQGTQFWWIELTRRCPGDLYSQLIELSTGMPYVQYYLQPFVAHLKGSSPEPESPGLNRAVMRHTVTVPTACDFHALEFQRPVHIQRWVPLHLSGGRLQPSPHSRVGVLFALEPSQTDLLALYQLTLNRGLYRIRA